MFIDVKKSKEVCHKEYMTENQSSADTAKNNIPWVEKYRPTRFDSIVLDPLNRHLFTNILKNEYFPNVLFYGPPGTGKTTTIINLIQAYQEKRGEVSRGTILHLNASDERGIDIIRNQIYQFVRSKNLFEKGIKFVILDEVDYMTKNAQQALKYLLQSSGQNVRFCLICNYISKIDESLKNEFISVRFNQLPKDEIEGFLENIAEKEGIELSKTAIETIQKLYNSDIRSMINFIQLHQNMVQWEYTIITDEVYDEIHRLLSGTSIEVFLRYMYDTSIKYNMDKRNILKNYLNHRVRNYPITQGFLNIAESLLHTSPDSNLDDILTYAFYAV
jgi:replication factor C subunit 3/5